MMKKDNKNFSFKAVHEYDKKIKELTRQLEELHSIKRTEVMKYYEGIREFLMKQSKPLTADQIEVMSNGAINKQSIASLALWADKARLTDKVLAKYDNDDEGLEMAKRRLFENGELCLFPTIPELHREGMTITRRFVELDENGDMIPDSVKEVTEVKTVYYIEK